jgi:hypothetical protein
MSDGAPDRPAVPRPRRSILITIYAIAAAAVLGAWVFAGATGMAFGSSSSHDTVPASMRSSPGGYRAFHFWHSGYQGGK